jgi:O-antigen/teichoic acid export membrane protein
MFGPAFAAAATPFALLSVAAALSLVQATTSNVLLAVGAERLYAKLMTAVVMTMVIADIPLCTQLGATGAAIAWVGAEVLVVALTGGAATRALGGLRWDFALTRWAIPMATGALVAGVALTRMPPSLLDLFLPGVSGLAFVALTRGAMWLCAYSVRR